MQRSLTFFLFSLLMVTTVSAQADIIDEAIGNIQQAINDAYKPDNGRDYDDARDNGWERQMSDDRRRQYDDRRRQFEDRRR
ncbi:DDRRRQL repeat protein YjdP, partial [Citrobacter youngae]